MTMDENLSAKRLLTGLAALLLVAGCASSAAGTPSPLAATPAATSGVTAAPTSAPATAVSSPSPRGAGQMSVGRGYHAAALLADGRVLVLGGFAGGSQPLASAELFDPKAGIFSPTGLMAKARSRGPAATRLADGRILVTGGFDGMTTIAAAELFDPATGTFTATGPMTGGRIYATATLLADDRVLVTGGAGDSGGLASAELYDPRSGTFTAAGPMTTARTGHTATRLADGRVLIVGGTPNKTGVAEGPGPCLASAEIFDPKSNAFTATGHMADARCGHAAALIADGRVLMTGGDAVYGDPTSFASAEIYDGRTGTFSPTGPMAVARIGQTATRLADGRILVAGGNDANYRPFASSELFDPKSGAFSPTGSMHDARTWYTATLLADDRVLVAGGDSENWAYDGPFNASAEIYDPAIGMFDTPAPGS
jgi:Galactose oxidase, central domain/Kelch motif